MRHGFLTFTGKWSPLTSASAKPAKLAKRNLAATDAEQTERTGPKRQRVGDISSNNEMGEALIGGNVQDDEEANEHENIDQRVLVEEGESIKDDDECAEC